MDFNNYRDNSVTPPVDYAKVQIIKPLVEILSVADSLPGAATDLPGCTIAAATSPRRLEYTFTPSNAGVLTVYLKKTGETDRTIKQYGGETLGNDAKAAGSGYPGEIKVPTGWSVDFRYSGADTGTFILDVFGANP